MFGSTVSAGRYDELIIFGCLLGFYVGYGDGEEMSVAVEIKRYANYGIVRFLSKTAPRLHWQIRLYMNDGQMRSLFLLVTHPRRKIW